VYNINKEGKATRLIIQVVFYFCHPCESRDPVVAKYPGFLPPAGGFAGMTVRDFYFFFK
jgi:hypothetical protein